MLWLATKMEIRNVFVILRIRFRCIALILVKNLDEIYLARSRLQVTGKSFLRASGINVKVDIAKRSSIAYRTFIAEPQNYIKVNQETVRKHKTLKKWRLFIDFWLTGINWHYWLWWWPNIFFKFPSFEIRLYVKESKYPSLCPSRFNLAAIHIIIIIIIICNNSTIQQAKLF